LTGAHEKRLGFGVDGEHRDHNPEPNHADENRQEDDADGGTR